MEYVPIVVAIAGVHAEVLHSLGAATGRAGERKREEEIIMVESAYLLFREQFDLDVSHGRVQSYQRANLGACHSRLRGTRDSSHTVWGRAGSDLT